MTKAILKPLTFDEALGIAEYGIADYSGPGGRRYIGNQK